MLKADKALEKAPMQIPVKFEPGGIEVMVAKGSSLLAAAARAGVYLAAPCGGSGACGRCKVEVISSASAARPAAISGVAGNHVLACASRVTEAMVVKVPEANSHWARPLSALPPMEVSLHPPLQSRELNLSPPQDHDNSSDLARLKRALEQQGLVAPSIAPQALANLSTIMRQHNWQIQASVYEGRIVEVAPLPAASPLALAIDLGTTSVWLELLDLGSGASVARACGPNLQIGEDVISRIIAAAQPGGLASQQRAAVQSINNLLQAIFADQGLTPERIKYVSLAGNTIMSHLLLGLDCRFLRLPPYVPAADVFPTYNAARLGLNVSSGAPLALMPAVASYVGGDIVAGIMACAMHQDERLTLFIDLGTNGEVVVGNREWMVCAAASAGPAFEGGGITSGMSFAPGAIYDFSLKAPDAEPWLAIVGNGPALGICGSGLIALCAALLEQGIMEPGGRLLYNAAIPRLRQGPEGTEYVVAGSGEKEISVNEADLQNLLRAKGAMYAAYITLLEAVGLDINRIERVILAGSFGGALNLEQAITIGLLPELPAQNFSFAGNASLNGARMAALNQACADEARQIKNNLTSIELGEQPAYMVNYTAALFFPHTQADKLFPITAKTLGR